MTSVATTTNSYTRSLVDFFPTVYPTLDRIYIMTKKEAVCELLRQGLSSKIDVHKRMRCIHKQAIAIVVENFQKAV